MRNTMRRHNTVMNAIAAHIARLEREVVAEVAAVKAKYRKTDEENVERLYK